MKEIGGYFEFENFRGKDFYSEFLKFNCSRNSLRFLIKKKNIKKIYLPILLCGVVYEACRKEKIIIQFYNIDENFLPILECTDGVVYIVNYYGLLSNDAIEDLKNKYKNIIIDNTHAFFQGPVNNVDTIYNCRKYFGVPDGSYLYTNIDNESYDSYQSTKDMFEHLFGRLEDNASLYYNIFNFNDKKFDDMEIKKMSKETINIMKAIDYDYVLTKRQQNFDYLDKHLLNIQKLKLQNRGTFMYPLYIGDCKTAKALKNYLIDNKIYVPTFWTNIPDVFKLNIYEQNYISIIPLPIDQRYDLCDMEYIVKLINNFYGDENNGN